MSEAISRVKDDLRASPKKWLVTGVAGFIGSNLLEELIRLGQTVVGLDNLSTGHSHNLEEVRQEVGAEAWERFTFIKGDIRNLTDCRTACRGVEFVLHQAALGSVPRSIDDPIRTHQSNIDGFLNMLLSARDEDVKRFVYASSSSTYGDHPSLPKQEDVTGRPLSPYAVTKCANELYAGVFAKNYGIECIGLRYFNVFGRRQDPNGAYAAVIPRWIGEMLAGTRPTINGDGETSRDFCYIDNTVQANLLAALTVDREAVNQIYNVAGGGRTTLNELFGIIRDMLGEHQPRVRDIVPLYGPFRPGDIQHSHADIAKAERLLGYGPGFDVPRGMAETLAWFCRRNDSAIVK